MRTRCEPLGVTPRRLGRRRLIRAHLGSAFPLLRSTEARLDERPESGNESAMIAEARADAAAGVAWIPIRACRILRHPAPVTDQRTLRST